MTSLVISTVRTWRKVSCRGVIQIFGGSMTTITPFWPSRRARTARPPKARPGCRSTLVGAPPLTRCPSEKGKVSSFVKRWDHVLALA